MFLNITKPILDIFLFSKKLAELLGWEGPLVVIGWYVLSGIVIKFISPPFSRLIAMQQRLEGEYHSS